MKSNNFFYVKKFPKLTFTEGTVEKDQNGTLSLKGNITWRETSKPVSLIPGFYGTTTDFYGDQKAGFEAHKSINRQDFGFEIVCHN